MHPIDEDSYTAHDDRPARLKWDGIDRRGQSGQLLELHNAVAQLAATVTLMSTATANTQTLVAWLCSLGKWSVTAILGVAVVAGPMIFNAGVALDRNQTAQDKRLDNLESNISVLLTSRQHILDRSREDHRTCHMRGISIK